MKSQKISNSDQYFLSYVKKTTGGGQIDPPPGGIGLNITKVFIYLQNIKFVFLCTIVLNISLIERILFAFP